jgi:hypothetical protein
MQRLYKGDGARSTITRDFDEYESLTGSVRVVAEAAGYLPERRPTTGALGRYQARRDERHRV